MMGTKLTCLGFLQLLLIFVLSSASTFYASPWAPLGAIADPVSLASVIYLNSTLVVVGGCDVPNCTSQRNTFSLYDPIAGAAVSSTAPPQFSTGFAGEHSTVELDGQLYVLRSCTYYAGAVPDEDVRIQYSAVMQLDVANEGAINETYFQLPLENVRGNASCVNIREKVYIVGGFNLSSMQLMKTIDMVDLIEMSFTANVTSMPAALMNAAVGSDTRSIVVTGGTMEGGQPNNKIWVHYPSSIMTDEAQHGAVRGVGTSCSWDEALPNWEILVAPRGRVSLSVYGGVTVVANENRTYFAAMDARAPGEFTWTTYDMRPQQPAVEQPNSCWASIPEDINGSSVLTLYRIGGNQISPSSVIASVSKSFTNVALPTADIPAGVITDGKFVFAFQGANMSDYCSGSQSPCAVRLSSEMTCKDDAAGTAPVQYVYSHHVGFSLTGDVPSVYVCFTFGVTDPRCLRSTAPYFPTNLLDPISIVPKVTSAPLKPSPTSNTSILLYVLGALAALTTIVAVLLVAKLRKVPDEGLLTNGTPAVGYGTHQEERYRIISKIGEGTFSVVYLVHRRADGAKFALKHMECQSDLQRHEAVKECEIVRSLQGHPNVINLIDMFMNYEFDNSRHENSKAVTETLNQDLLAEPTKRSRHLCLVMQYHPAGDLRKWTLSQPNNMIPESVLLSVAYQVCSVLKHCHAHDPPIIHRDLKPENILISHTSTHASTTLPIVVTDFGLARMQEGTHCASGAGTVPYVAPECFKKKYTVQCDLWSLGCVMYAVASRRVNNSNVRLMFQEVNNPDFHPSIRRDLSKLGYTDLFITFVLKLLEPLPESRLTSKQAYRLFIRKKEEVSLNPKGYEMLKSGSAEELPQSNSQTAPSSKAPKGVPTVPSSELLAGSGEAKDTPQRSQRSHHSPVVLVADDAKDTTATPDPLRVESGSINFPDSDQFSK